MKIIPFFPRPAWVAASGAGALLLLAACASDRADRANRPPPETAAAVAEMPEMEGHGVFLSGQVETEVLLSHGGFAPRDAAQTASTNDGGGRGRASGSGGGFGGGGRHGGMGGRGGGGGGARDASSTRDSSNGEPVPNIRPVNAPPVQFHLRLTNQGTEPIEVEVTDFNSELGNFVVQPPKITLPPGGSVEADPMTSRLGVSADEIPLTVTIRAQGQTDKQILTLRPKPDAVPAAPTAPAPSPL